MSINGDKRIEMCLHWKEMPDVQVPLECRVTQQLTGIHCFSQALFSRVTACKHGVPNLGGPLKSDIHARCATFPRCTGQGRFKKWHRLPLFLFWSYSPLQWKQRSLRNNVKYGKKSMSSVYIKTLRQLNLEKKKCYKSVYSIIFNSAQLQLKSPNIYYFGENILNSSQDALKIAFKKILTWAL